MPARTDQATDPVVLAALLTARRGQAFWSRQLARTSDDDLDAPSLLPGWTRRHLVAHVGLNARAITHLTEWALTGVEHPMYDSPTQRADDIALASTLPPQALRNLSDHAAIHLSVEWRDLPPTAWTHEVRTAQGRTVPVSETVWMRSREVWVHAVDLGGGASFTDLPPDVVDALLVDVTGAWARRRTAEGLPQFILQPVDRPDRGPAEAASGAVVLTGPAARLAQWATGRGAVDVRTTGGAPVPTAPRWL